MNAVDRVEWLAQLCGLTPLAQQAVRLLPHGGAWMALGALVDELGAPAPDVAQLAAPRSPLREWGIVRFLPSPEPRLALNPRIARFLEGTDEWPAGAVPIGRFRARVRITRPDAG